jgi:hypothetical protein
MTPQERKLLDELFDRLASLENGPRDPDAMRAINEGLRRAPNALYPLVQTALVQDEALKRADARIRELEDELGVEAGEPAKQPGFLDSMRDALLGKSQGSVPSVRPGAASGDSERSPWGNTTGQQQGYGGGGYGAPPPGYGAQPVGAGGGSFLGTAAATAAGVVGGALLMNSFRGMFGGHQMGQSAFGSGSAGSPWGGGSDASGSDLARDAGLNDIGRGGGGGDYGGSQQAGLFDSSSDNSDDDAGDNDVDVGGDFGGGGGDSSDA